MQKGTTQMEKKSAKKGKKVRFQLVTEPGNEVYVAGSFNKWDARAHLLKFASDAGSHLATLTLPPGRHEYKFIVNGKWCLDPKCPETVPNPLGDVNSVIVV